MFEDERHPVAVVVGPEKTGNARAHTERLEIAPLAAVKVRASRRRLLAHGLDENDSSVGQGQAGCQSR